ncbi:MAG: DUF2975 domain-containing protein [Verrucomicrobiota bacterium]
MKRIKTVSRVARFVVIAILLFYGWFFIRVIFSGAASFLPSRIAQKSSESWDWFLLSLGIISTAYQIVLCVWYWKLARLFRFYERGLIFGADTIRCIKKLGLLCVMGGLLLSTTAIMSHSTLGNMGRQGLIPKLTSTPPAVITTTVTHYRTGFFSFDFGTGFDFGLVLAGIVIVLVAWIMDEGRKIQEEQELTV